MSTHYSTLCVFFPVLFCGYYCGLLFNWFGLIFFQSLTHSRLVLNLLCSQGRLRTSSPPLSISGVLWWQVQHTQFYSVLWRKPRASWIPTELHPHSLLSYILVLFILSLCFRASRCYLEIIYIWDKSRTLEENSSFPDVSFILMGWFCLHRSMYKVCYSNSVLWSTSVIVHVYELCILSMYL